MTPPSGARADDRPLLLGLAASVLFFAASGSAAYLDTRALARGAGEVARSHERLAALEEVVSTLKDAETAQRRYLITGAERDLEPYDLAAARVGERLAQAERLAAGDPELRGRVGALRGPAEAKLAELAGAIGVRRAQGFDAARRVVETGRGQAAMDALRAGVRELRAAEQRALEARQAELDRSFGVAVARDLVTSLVGVLLAAAAAAVAARSARARRRREWLRAGEAGLDRAMLGERSSGDLGRAVLGYFADTLGARAGAFFVREGVGFRRVAGYGLPAGGAPESFAPGEGLLGQSALDARAFHLASPPEGYLAVGSGLGRGTPRHLAVVPALSDGAVNAVFELGFLAEPDPAAAELLEAVAGAVGLAVGAAAYRAHLQRLLEETRHQAAELQTQGEELRVSNEELEEQGSALKESYHRLEQQQAELEQTNVQLEEQTQELAAQRDGLAQSAAALEDQARELERASRHKSDFLANMSHELRTPLNSSLILAKLLADNPQGNLTPEQVRYAETIRGAGNDLLVLINDILDLSKIEAGHLEALPEPVRVADVVDGLARAFAPAAAQKGLSLTASVAPGTPEVVETDRRRLEQVLKNLLSNALKFTERGRVELAASALPGGGVTLSVADTGIGIAPEQHSLVFEAFRQADGTINRKYGGTGLGLSISRELARLLGGTLTLASEPGRGSTFAVTLPARLPAPAPAAPAKVPPPSPPRPAPAPEPRPAPAPGRRLLLVVEDDAAFAGILADLAAELGFESLAASGADEAVSLATRHLPSAVVLDVGLPDHSGLTVLDRLKRDPRTRHIPVHVVSAGDHAPAALALGAVGYLAKPASRAELAEALGKLETRLEQRVRRVLVVEDDPVQLDSLRRLLGTQEVETVGASSAAECLAALGGAAFDCMVLDLTLPDATGYSLLETLARDPDRAFPPVIVYTGRDLSPGDEEKLRRYSKSIIIKGAKSPERLLDEVTLFLHQVVSELPPEQQRMLEAARGRDAALEGRRILVVEDDVRNVFALASILEPQGAEVKIARNGREALDLLTETQPDPDRAIDLVLMDVMMPEMDGLTATREIRKRPEWKKLPVIVLTAKAMRDDQETCLAAGANDYAAKPLDVEKLLSLVRVWMPR